jgi:hypothetical protein
MPNMYKPTYAGQRAAKGAAWLDKHRPGWANKVDTEHLDMGDAWYCIWGQLAGDYNEKPLRFWLSGSAVRYGFLYDPYEGRYFDVPRLNKAWRAEIDQRRAPATQ